MIPILIISFCILGVFSNFPHWPSWLTCLQSTFQGKGVPAKAKLNQLKFLFIHVIQAPARGAANCIDELIFKGYKKVQIEPIFIVGQPRCGSTLLHRTMAKSGHHLAIRHYQWRYPYVCIQKLFQVFRLEGYFQNISYWPSGKKGSEAEKMHPNRLNDWEEDGIFFEENLCHHFFVFLRFPYKNVLNKCSEYSSLGTISRRKFIQEHKKAIQKIAWSQNMKHVSYLSKEVVSHSMIPDLVKEYPKAKFIIVVRKSGDFMSSLIPLVRVSTTTKNGGYDPCNDCTWVNLVTRKIQKDCLYLCKLSEELIAKESQYLLRSEQLFGDVEHTIMNLYSWLDLSVSHYFTAELSNIKNRQQSRNKGYANQPLDLDMKGFQPYDDFVTNISSQ